MWSHMGSSQHMPESQPKQFGKLRNFLWPIHGYEHKKLIPMFFLFLLISFIYNLLRCMKVTLVVTTGAVGAGSGAEVIPFLKLWGVLPSAVILTYFFTLLASRFNREQVFYIVIAFFLGFYALFTLFLHPNRDALELVWLPQRMSAVLPEGCNGLVSAIRYWPTSLFYILSELWSSVVLSMLFWGYANEVTSVEEAKRFYAIFALGANASGIFSGQIGQMLTMTEYNPNLPFGNNAWDQSIFLQISMVLVLGMVILVLFRWLNKQHTRNENLSAAELFTRKKKNQVSLLESFKCLTRSRYMLYITIIVVAYNIVYNLADVVWTDQVNARMMGNASAISNYMNNVISITGILATLSALMLSGNVIRRFGWTVTAVITPLIWLTMGVGVFSCMLFQTNEIFSGVLFQLFGVPAQALVVLFCSSQICLGRASKYTVFDESKEIAFIPLPQEEQRKGKAVVDGIASRFGKAGGSLLIQVLLVSCASLSNATPYIAIIFFTVIAFWMYAVNGLGKMVRASVDKDLLEKAEASKSAPLGREQQPASTTAVKEGFAA